MELILLRLQKLVLICFDWLVTCRRNNTIRSDLVLIRLDAIGDFILWLESAKHYRRLYPDKKITLITNSLCADLARQLPFWDAVWAIDVRSFQKKMFYRFKILNKIRQAGFEIAIQPTYSRELIFGDSIIRICGSNQRIGYVGDLSNISRQAKGVSDRWYTQLLPATNTPLTELERNTEFMTHLSGEKQSSKLIKLPKLTQLPEHLMFTQDYFIVFPGASWTGRQWPVAFFSNCLDKLLKQHGWQAVLCGIESEYSLCQTVIERSNSEKIVNLSGKTSLSEFVELIRGARLLISNETSAVHIAAAVDTPSVCILGGGHFGRFLPYSKTVEGSKPVAVFSEMDCFGCNWQCSQPHEKNAPMPCISQVSVQSVLDAVDVALQNKQNSQYQY